MQSAGCYHLVMLDLPFGFKSCHLFRTNRFRIFNKRLPVTTQDNICSTTCHIGGNGHGFWATCLGDNFSLALMLLGVQYVMLHAFLIKQIRQLFTGLNRCCTDQHWRTFGLNLFNLADNALVFTEFGQENLIFQIYSRNRLMGWNDNHVQIIGRFKFCRFGVRRSGHA